MTVTKCSSFVLGLLVIISNSAYSYAKLKAGNISVPTQIHNINIFDKGKGIKKIIYAIKGKISVTLEVNK